MIMTILWHSATLIIQTSWESLGSDNQSHKSLGKECIHDKAVTIATAT